MTRPAHDETWIEYWAKTPDDPYLSAEAAVVAANLIQRFGLDRDDVVLDFGCGYGYVAEHLAGAAGQVRLWDAVPDVMTSAAGRISADNVSTVDLESDELPSFDLIVVNSVVQYMSPETLRDWVERWSAMLADGGSIALTDVPGKSPSLFGEGISWFWLTLKNGVLVDALRFARENGSRYRKARDTSNLAVVTEQDLEQHAERAGMKIVKAPRNLAYQRGRDSYVLTKP